MGKEGLRLFFEEGKARRNMVQWLNVMFSSPSSSSSLFLRSERLEQKPQECSSQKAISIHGPPRSLSV